MQGRFRVIRSRRMDAQSTCGRSRPVVGLAELDRGSLALRTRHNWVDSVDGALLQWRWDSELKHNGNSPEMLPPPRSAGRGDL